MVLATDIGGLRQFVAASPGLGDARLARRGSPRCVPRRRSSFPALAGPPGPRRPPRLPRHQRLRRLDNVSVLDRYEGEAARWAARTGGSVVELHAYALTDGRRATCATRW